MGKAIKNKMRGMNLWAKVGMVLFVTVLMSSFMVPAESSAAPTANGRIVTGINTNTPQTSAYTASSNTFAALAATQTGAIPTFIVDKAAPTRTEHIAGYVTTGGVLYIYRWNGTTWTNETSAGGGWGGTVTVGGNGVDGRRFDIAYEKTTGNAVVVYSTNTATGSANHLAYRTWNGTIWSAASNITAARLTTQIATVVKLASSPVTGSNQIAMAVQGLGTSTSNGILTSLVWSGSAWGNEPAAAHSTGMTGLASTFVVQNDCIDLAYENTTGNHMVVWTQNTPQQYYRYYTTGTTTWGSATSFGTGRGPNIQIFAASNPASGSNQILVGFQRNADPRVYAGIWNGTSSSWTYAVAYVNSTTQNGQTPAVEQKTITGGWLNQGGTSAAVVIWGSVNATEIDYAYSTNGTSFTQTTFTPSGALAASGVRWMSVDVDPLSLDTMMLTFSELNTNNKLWAKRFQYTAPSTFALTNADGGAVITSALTNVTSQNFSFAYDRYSLTAPTVTSPTVTGIGSTTATLGANITSNGNGTISARGITWGTSSATNTAHTNTVQLDTSNTTGVFTQSVTGLTAGTKIYYNGYATNGQGTTYSSDGSFYTQPTTQASNVNFASVGSGGMTVGWTAGNGDGVIVVMRQTATSAVAPTNGTLYTGTTTFGTGATTGTGNYVIYSGANTTTSVNVTGLSGGVGYTVTAYAYSGIVADSGVNYGIDYLASSPATNSQTTTNFVLTAGQGTGSATGTVYQGDTKKTLAVFTLSTNTLSDTVSQIIVTGTNLNTTNVAKAQLWVDTNGTGVYSSGYTQVGNDVASFTSNTAVFSGLSQSVTTTSVQYIMTVDIAATPTNTNTMTGYVTSGGVTPASYGVAYSDATDGSVTISTNRTSAGAASVTAVSPSRLAVSMPYTLDTDGNNTYTVEYSLAGQNSWTAFATNAAHVPSPYTTTITGLTPGTSYDVRLTYNDSTGVYGNNPQPYTVSTMAAGVDQLNAWTNVYTSTGGASPNTFTSNSFTVSSGSNRLLLAAVCVKAGSSITLTPITVQLDSSSGTSFTQIANSNSVGTQREQCWMGYLTDSQVPAGNHAIYVSATSSATATAISAMVGTYQNVDQVSPLASSSANEAASASAVPLGATGSLTYAANSALALVAVNYNAAATFAANQPIAGFNVVMSNNTNHSTFAAQAFEAASGSMTNSSSTITFGGTTSNYSALVIAALNHAPNATYVATPTAVNGTNSNIVVNPNCLQDGNNNNSVTISWNYAGNGFASPINSYSSGHCGSYSISGLTPGALYDVQIVFSDSDTLTGPGAATQVVSNIAVTEVRTQPGTATAVSNTPDSIDVTAPFNYDYNNNGTITVQYSLAGQGSYNTGTTAPHGATSPYAFKITSLTPNTSYDVKVTFTDSDGVLPTAVQTISGVTTQTTNWTVAGTATAVPTVGNETTSITYSMPYTYDSNSDNTYTVDYQVAGSGSWTNVVTNATHTTSPYSANITGLTPGVTYNVRMTYSDGDGVDGTNPQTVSVYLPVDATTTGAMSIRAYDTKVVVTVSFTDDNNDSNSCQLDYGTSTSYSGGSVAMVADRTNNAFTATITNLSASTTYYFRATFTDLDGVNGTNPVLGVKKTENAWVNNPMLHNSTNMSSTKWASSGGWGIPGAKYDAFSCSSCHIPNTSNIKWVRTSIDATGVARTVFYKNATSAGHDSRAVKTSSTNPCEVCHSATKYHRYNQTDTSGVVGGTSSDTHQNGTVCNGCHPHRSGFAVDMTNCIGCHNAAQGTRRAITTEFAMTWSHKRSAGGTVTNADCKVCHLEGDAAYASQHGGGNVLLRDPDTGGQVMGVTFNGTGDLTQTGNYVTTAVPAVIPKFSRDLTKTLEGDPNWLAIAAMQINFCLKCHDADGAFSTLARVPGGTAMQPFGVAITGQAAPYNSNGAGNVVDVNTSFNTSNAAYHPVRGRGNNSYTQGTRMVSPWSTATKTNGNNTQYGYLISCWDCHAASGASGTQTSTVTAHGGTVTLRAPFRVAGTTAATLLCLNCHATAYATTTANHGTGSAFASGGSGSDMNAATFNNCSYCHGNGAPATAYNATSTRPLRAEDIHGVNDRTPGTVGSKWATSGSRPYAFIRNSLSAWGPASSATETITGPHTCTGVSGATCNSNMNNSNYTPGGVY